MAGTLDAAQVNEVRHLLASLGYRNASAEDIAMTLQHVGEAKRREINEQLPLQPSTKRENSAQRTSTSPPRGANDLTMAPHEEEEEVEKQSGKGNRRSTSASLKQWPGFSSHSFRKGLRTPVNSTGTGHYPRHGRGLENYPTREYRHHKPFCNSGSVVVEENLQSAGGDERRGSCRVDRVGAPFGGGRKSAAVKDVVIIPTDVGTLRESKNHGFYPTMADYMNPQARLERHLKQYEKDLKTLYADGYNEDGQGRTLDYEENEDYNAYDVRVPGDNEEDENNLALFYGDTPQRPITPDMPLRPNRVLLNQRGANIIYNLTGDSRYKYRGGLGVPLYAVLGPNGSTLRQRADPVRRGQQMRDIWEKDKFLSQHRRKEDRWCMH